MINILPNIEKRKRSIKFSNPLSGKIYNNYSFIRNCHYEVGQVSQVLPKHRNEDKKHKSVLLETKAVIENKKINKNLYTTNYFTKNKNKEPQRRQISEKKLNVQVNQIKKTKNTYNDLQIKILDRIQSTQDLKDKKLKVNFGIYFNLFFKPNLGGTTTYQFLHLTQKYLRIIIQNNQLNNKIQLRDYPPQCFILKSKFALIDKIRQLQEKGTINIAQAIIKYYCVPTQQFRQSCLRDIIHMLKRQLYQKFNIGGNHQYVLLNSNGNVIKDVCEIYFSTTQLFITEKSHYQRKFSNYLAIVQSSNMTYKKLTFSQGLKKSFRNRIVGGKFQDYSEDRQKNNNRTLTSFGKKEKTEQLLNQKSSKKSLKNFLPYKTSNQSFFSPKKKTQKKSQTSLSDKKKNVTLSFLKLQQKITDQFYRLVGRNSFFDMAFNHIHENQLLLKVLFKHCSLFTNKSQQQSYRILNSAEVEKNQSQSISLQDFKKIRIIAQCKGDKQNIITFVRNYMPFNEFGEMNRLDLRSILGFILNNEKSNRDIVQQVIWSWLQKNNLVQNQVIKKNILQCWYEKNKLAYVMLISLIFGTNEVSTLQMAYEIIV